MFWCTLTELFKFQLVGLVQVNLARACAFNALFPSFFSVISAETLLGEWAEKMQPVELGASLSRGAWTDKAGGGKERSLRTVRGDEQGGGAPRSPGKCHRVKLVQRWSSAWVGSHTARPDSECQDLCEIAQSSLKRGNYSSPWSLRDDSSLSHFTLLKFVSDIMGAKFFL